MLTKSQYGCSCKGPLDVIWSGPLLKQSKPHKEILET